MGKVASDIVAKEQEPDFLRRKPFHNFLDE